VSSEGEEEAEEEEEEVLEDAMTTPGLGRVRYHCNKPPPTRLAIIGPKTHRNGGRDCLKGIVL
jgi:hypothetical protein